MQYNKSIVNNYCDNFLGPPKLFAVDLVSRPMDKYLEIRLSGLFSNKVKTIASPHPRRGSGGGLGGTCPLDLSKNWLNNTWNRPKITVPPYQCVCPPPRLPLLGPPLHPMDTHCDIDLARCVWHRPTYRNGDSRLQRTSMQRYRPCQTWHLAWNYLTYFESSSWH